MFTATRQRHVKTIENSKACIPTTKTKLSTETNFIHYIDQLLHEIRFVVIINE